MSKDNDVNEYAFSKVTLTATNKEDFENILKSLKLKESLGLDTLSMENIDKLVEKNPNYNTDLKFLDLSKGAMLKEHENPYLKLYNEAFIDKQIELTDLNEKIKPILIQITKHLNVDRFNHYRPASKLASKGIDVKSLHATTLDNFEKVFIEINKLF